MCGQELSNLAVIIDNTQKWKLYIVGAEEFHSSQTLETLRTKAIAIPKSKIGEHGANNILKCQIETVVKEFLKMTLTH